MFKKRAPTSKPRRVADESDDEEEDTNVTPKIDDLRLMQKARLGSRGVSNMPEEKKEEVAEDSSEDEGGLLDIEKKFGATGTQRLGHVVDRHLDEFLDKQLAALKPQEREEISVVQEERTKEEQNIYVIPEEWTARGHEIEPHEDMTWQQGLTEVPLDVHCRIENIVKTEQAKKRILEERRRDDGGEMRDRAMSTAFGDRFRNYGRYVGHDHQLEAFEKNTSGPY